MERKLAVQGHGVSSRRPTNGDKWAFSLLTTPLRTCAAVALTCADVAVLLHADYSTDVIAAIREIKCDLNLTDVHIHYICQERCSSYWAGRIGKPAKQLITHFTGFCVELRSFNDGAAPRLPRQHTQCEHLFQITESTDKPPLHYHLPQTDLLAVKDFHIFYCSITVTTEASQIGPVLLDSQADLIEAFNVAHRKFERLNVLRDGIIEWSRCIQSFLHVQLGSFLEQTVNPKRNIKRHIHQSMVRCTLLAACQHSDIIKSECMSYLIKIKKYYHVLSSINFNDLDTAEFVDYSL